MQEGGAGGKRGGAAPPSQRPAQRRRRDETSLGETTLTSYELEREANIAANQAKMQELGLLQRGQALATPAGQGALPASVARGAAQPRAGQPRPSLEPRSEHLRGGATLASAAASALGTPREGPPPAAPGGQQSAPAARRNPMRRAAVAGAATAAKQAADEAQ